MLSGHEGQMQPQHQGGERGDAGETQVLCFWSDSVAKGAGKRRMMQVRIIKSFFLSHLEAGPGWDAEPDKKQGEGKKNSLVFVSWARAAAARKLQMKRGKNDREVRFPFFSGRRTDAFENENVLLS